MPKDNETPAVPSGSVVVENGGEEVRQPVTPEGSGQEQAGQEGGAGQAQGQEAPDQGQQGPGSEDFAAKLAAQLDELNSSIKTMGAQPQGDPQGQQGSQEPARDYDSELAELQKQAADGDISYNDLISKSQAIHEAKTQDLVQNSLKQYHEEQQTRTVQERFLSENPGFQDFIASPENQALQQANPVLDNVSSYYAAKAQSAEAKATELEAQLAQLQQEREAAVGGAAQRQSGRVGTESGSDVRQSQAQGTKNLSARDGMMAALKAMREAQ